MVFFVVELHDLPGDGWLEGAVVICVGQVLARDWISCQTDMADLKGLHLRSGRVALVEMRRAPAAPDMATAFDRVATAPARRAPHTVERKTEVAIVAVSRTMFVLGIRGSSLTGL